MNGNDDQNDGKELAGAKIFQYVANLMQSPVDGFEPEPVIENPPFELIVSELLSGKREAPPFDFDHPKPTRLPKILTASYLVIAGLIKGNKTHQDKILDQIHVKDLEERSFERFLFGIIVDRLREGNGISISQIQESIPDWGAVSLGGPLEGPLKLGIYFKWAQVLATNPTSEQIEKAIEIIQSGASRVSSQKLRS